MCGINGILGNIAEQDRKGLVARMNKAIAHRGPDADGIFDEGEITFGHRRLSIIDLSPEGNQPFYSSDGNLVMVFNGEIYNYRELKKELSEFSFRTNGDSEVVLASWMKWRERCVEHLTGMFALAIYEKSSGLVFMARDRMGVKPLYYTMKGNALAFSSEVRALLTCPFVSGETDQEALVDYLRYQTVHAPRTIFSDIKMLMPGHFMLWNKGKVIVQEYWNATQHVEKISSSVSYDEVKFEVRKRLEQSVKYRLVADVPFGAFLSGGIDSSAVVALMSTVSDTEIKTFNISFSDDAFSESKYARLVADKFGTTHTEIILKPEDFLQYIPHALDAMDHPSGDGPNTWVVSKVTKEAGVTMALSGIGGDELFAGYDVFQRMYHLRSKRWMQFFPMFMRRSGAQVLQKIKPGVRSDKLRAFMELSVLDLEHVYPINRQILTEQKISALLKGKDLPQRSVENILQDLLGQGTPGKHLFALSRISVAEMYTYLQNVLLRDTDQMSMAHALEVREPFLDHALIEYVLGVKNEFKYPHTPKKLLVDAMGDLLPSEIVNRPKMGFTFPWKNWMKNELRSFCEERIHWLSAQPMFDGKEVGAIWQAFLRDDPRYPWSRVWGLVVLGHYLSKQHSR
jgi:asparagine synthase (glutamine-hydrolysing)